MAIVAFYAYVLCLSWLNLYECHQGSEHYHYYYPMDVCYSNGNKFAYHKLKCSSLFGYGAKCYNACTF